MKVNETITLSRLDRPASDYLKILSGEFQFKLSGRSLLLHSEYDPSRIDGLETTLADRGLKPKVHHSIYPEFSKQDYAKADLAEVQFPDLWIDDISFKKICSKCGKKHVSVDFSRTVPRVSSHRHLLSVNGEFHIVSAEGTSRIERSSLKGATFPKFDLEGRYYYFSAESDIDPVVVRETEAKGYRGICSECGQPDFERHFGPLRFLRARWNGDDFIRSIFAGGLVVTSAAFDFLKSLEKGAEKGYPAFLEEA